MSKPNHPFWTFVVFGLISPFVFLGFVGGMVALAVVCGWQLAKKVVEWM